MFGAETISLLLIYTELTEIHVFAFGCIPNESVFLLDHPINWRIINCRLGNILFSSLEQCYGLKKTKLIFSVIITAMVLNDYLPDTLTLHTYFNSLNSRLGDLGHLGLGDGRLVLIQ